MEVINVSSSASKALRGGDWGYSLEIASCIRADDEVPGRMDSLNGCRLVVGSTLPLLQ
jgi:hypothetical protein